MKGILRVFLIAFVSALAGYVVWDRVETHRLASDIAAIAARGEPIDLSEPAAAPLTPEQQEAAQLYLEAAARAREISQQDVRMSGLDVDGVVGRVDLAEIEGTYRKDAPALQLLDRATSLPFAGFGDALESPEWVSVSGLQALSALSALRADLLASHGEGDAAASALIAAVRTERTLHELFNRYVVGARQFGSLRILLRHTAPSATALEALQRAFAELPDEDGLAVDLMRRRARLIESWNDDVPGNVPGIVALLLHPFVVRAARVELEQFPAVLAAAHEPWPGKLGLFAAMVASSPMPQGRSPVRNLVAGPARNIAALSAMPTYAGLNLVIRRVSVATLGIERYRRAHAGGLPPDLASLVPAFLPAVPIDPFTGQPIIYKIAAQNYMVYSTDVNRIDDEGKLYGTGSLTPMPSPRVRDFGISVPLVPWHAAQ